MLVWHSSHFWQNLSCWQFWAMFFLWFRAFKAMQKVSWDLSCACDFVFNLHVWCWRVSWGCSYLKGCEMNLLKLMYNWNGNKISKWIENVWNVLNWRNVHWPVSCVGRLRRVTWSAHVRYEGSTEHHLVVGQRSYRLLNAVLLVSDLIIGLFFFFWSSQNLSTGHASSH